MAFFPSGRYDAHESSGEYLPTQHGQNQKREPFFLYKEHKLAPSEVGKKAHLKIVLDKRRAEIEKRHVAAVLSQLLTYV